MPKTAAAAIKNSVLHIASKEGTMLALKSLFLLATLAAPSDVTLLEFSSPRCQPCQAMLPIVDRLVREGHSVRPVNVEQHTEITRQFKIEHVPTFVLMVDGQEAGRLVGVRSHADLVKLLASTPITPSSTKNTAAKETLDEQYTVRGQSPDGQRRGLGIFSRLGAMGKSSTAPGEPPVSIPASNSPPPGSDVGLPAIEIAAPPAAAPAPRETPAANAIPSTPADVPAFADERPSAAGPATSPAQRALAATVRLKIEDPQGHSYGTGTIIDVLKDEALVITCGHIFRESKGQGKISVDLHAPGARGPVPGQLISFDLTRDVALVSIRPGVEIAPAPVAGDIRKVVPGARAFSIGCDHGAEPSVHETRITAVNKYQSSPNYTASGMPVEGRSGGGLFLADGSLIGICNFADEQDNEGIYAALPTLHWQLDQIGQSEIYRKGTQAAAHQREIRPFALTLSDSRSDKQAAAADQRETKSEAAPPEMAELASLNSPAPQNQLPLTPVSSVRNTSPGDTEIICIVRSKSQPQGANEVIVVDQPTPEWIDLLSRHRPRTTAAVGPRDAAPIVRGQSN
jgi:thiol-disulfide isomerase/thioredoxin